MLKINKTEIFNKAVLVTEEGDVFYGRGIGKKGTTIGELCFNTAMTGYQEAISDPSYASQILMFTFPHIGINGVNKKDLESKKIYLNGVVFREISNDYSNWRGIESIDIWLKKEDVIGISNINTRDLTIKVRKTGALKVALFNGIKGELSIDKIMKKIHNWKGIAGADLASIVSCKKPYYVKAKSKNRKSIDIVAIDYGCKKNILELLSQHGFNVNVVPCNFNYKRILKYKPKGIFLSNGPGDPIATARACLDTIKYLMKKNFPMFGICLGHQLLGLALSAKTTKMHHGHHGVNQPVKNLMRKAIEITSQNHGFIIEKKSLPSYLKITHLSLFDNVIQGIEHKNKPFFGVQYHPESSPGPEDSRYLFEKFRNIILKS